MGERMRWVWLRLVERLLELPCTWREACRAATERFRHRRAMVADGLLDVPYVVRGWLGRRTTAPREAFRRAVSWVGALRWVLPLSSRTGAPGWHPSGARVIVTLATSGGGEARAAARSGEFAERVRAAREHAPTPRQQREAKPTASSGPDEVEARRAASVRQQLAVRQAELERREAALAADRRQLDLRAAELAALEQALPARVRQLEDRETELEQRRAEVDADAERRWIELEQRTQTALDLELRLDRQRLALEEREQTVTELELRVDQQQDELERQAPLLDRETEWWEKQLGRAAGATARPARNRSRFDPTVASALRRSRQEGRITT